MTGLKSKVLTAVLSLVIAFGLWLYVVTVVDPEFEETYYDVPVILQNDNVLTERGLMITSEKPTVTLKLSGNRTDLIKLDKMNINVIANVASIEAPGTHLLGYTVSYPGSIPNNAVSKQLGTPSLITLKVENKIKKTVDVAIDYQGAVPDGFVADTENAQLDHPAIEISGPESVVNKIQQARVQVNLKDQNKTIAQAFEYTLCDGAGEPVDAELVTTDVEKINLTVIIQKVKEIKLTVDVVPGGGATAQNSIIKIVPEKIWVSGSDRLLEGMEELKVGTVNLGEILTGGVLEFPIKLDGVNNETGVTVAQVEIQFPDLRTRTFSITNIIPQNVPEGMEVDMITQALDIKVRGPREQIDAMKESDIAVTVDFTNVQPGMVSMNAVVAFSGSFPDVGAFGTYPVKATLQESTDDR